MTKKEITDALVRLHFVGLWSISALAAQAALSRETISRALSGDISEQTQVRLAMVLKTISPHAPAVAPPKRKPGHFKRYLIRYYNLVRWCEILEHEGVRKKYAIPKKSNMSKDEAGFICCKLDYIAKRYLMDIFGTEYKRRRGTFGDCYPFEQWVKELARKTPTHRPELLKKIQERKFK